MMQRWASKVVLPSDPNGCWLWKSSIWGKGYASLARNGRKTSGHKYAYERFVGPVPEGMELDHLCGVRNCVNPAHLEAVTHLENIRRSVSARKTHCKHGHPFSGDNLVMVVGSNERFKRGCRECRKRSRRDRRGRIKQARMAVQQVAGGSND